MRARVIVTISLLLNVAMAIVLWQVYVSVSRHARATASAQVSPPPSNTTFRVAKTNIILNTSPFAWQKIESPDYDRYVFNLRSIGCPESTVRDIIVADVNQVYARKRRELNVNTNDLQWWLSDPDPVEVAAALAKERALEDERRTLLTHLLGTNWEQKAEEPPEALVLAGPVLGGLRPDQKEAVQEIVTTSRARVNEYLQQCDEAGVPPDPLELAHLREQTRSELAALLSPEQLQEFLLRYSNTAVQLRTDLRGLNATPEEFRRLFVATDPIDRELQLLGSDDDPATAAKRRRLQLQREAAIRQALGPERYDAYRSLNDADYRAALADAHAAGVPAQAGRALYEINQAAASERQRINGDASLTAAQREEQLKLVDQELKGARATLLEQPSPEETAAASPPANIFQHRVGPHETLAGLSLYYRVPLTDLLEANPGLDAGLVQPGQTVKIPNPPPLPWKPGIVPSK